MWWLFSGSVFAICHVLVIHWSCMGNSLVMQCLCIGVGYVLVSHWLCNGYSVVSYGLFRG